MPKAGCVNLSWPQVDGAGSSETRLGVGLSEREVAALDEFAHASGLSSRSASNQQAIRLLGDPEFEDSYAAAWDKREASGDNAAWESTTADGPVDAAR